MIFFLMRDEKYFGLIIGRHISVVVATSHVAACFCEIRQMLPAKNVHHVSLMFPVSQLLWTCFKLPVCMFYSQKTPQACVKNLVRIR